MVIPRSIVLAAALRDGQEWIAGRPMPRYSSFGAAVRRDYLPAIWQAVCACQIEVAFRCEAGRIGHEPPELFWLRQVAFIAALIDAAVEGGSCSEEQGLVVLREYARALYQTISAY